MGRASKKKQARRAAREALASSMNLSIISGVGDAESFAPELEHVKAALLYADHVTLYTPKNFLAAMWSHMSGFDAKALLNLLGQLDDATLAYLRIDRERVELAALIASTPPKRLTPEQREMQREFLDGAEVHAQGFREMGDQQLAASGVDALLPAIESGVLEMHPILQDEDLTGDFSEAMASRFLDRIQEVINSPGVYPSLDDEVARLTRYAIEEGLIDPAPHYARRAKNSGVGLGLLGKLPHFPRADVSEILDVRRELVRPLGVFRRAVVGLQADIQVDRSDPDFGPQVDELYVNQVRPALDEIDQLVHDNLSLRELTTRVVTDKAGPAAGVGVGTIFGLAVGGNPLLTSAVALALTGGTSLLRALQEERAERRKVEADQFYFLYETNRRL